jgi:hypothetical protein
MLEKILDRNNVEKALKQVIANKGVGGVDGMQFDELRPLINTHYQQLRTSILEGTYKPQAVKKVEILKPDGGTRMLGIPTVTDRLIQQCINQTLNGMYDVTFDEWSYGFRPNCSAHQATHQAQTFLNEGYVWILELDLEKFFDRVNHDKLMGILMKSVEDKRVLKLIRLYLTAGIMEGGAVSPRTEGTQSIKGQIRKLQMLIPGWINYFILAKGQTVLMRMDGLVRTRLRMVAWKHWKRPKTRVSNLNKLGASKVDAIRWGNGSKGYCRMANSLILKHLLNNTYWRKQGYKGFVETFKEKTVQLSIF